MPRDDKLWIGKFSFNRFECFRPGPEVSLADITKVSGFGAFYGATPIQNFIFFEPDKDVIVCVCRACIVGLKTVLPHMKRGVVFKGKLRALAAGFFTNGICLPGGKGENAFIPVKFKARGAVVVRMGSNTQYHPLMVPDLYAVQQRLKLCGIPGCIHQNDAAAGN